MEHAAAAPRLHPTPMMRQHAVAKSAYPDALVLFRLGDFYEMFGDDATVGARVLELVLTSREIGKGQRIPMCGVPVHAVESYSARLVTAGYKVAICEQMEDPKLTRGLVRREVVRVLTPGTVVEEGMLEERANNFLVALYVREEAYGLAALDVSTGEFFATTLSGEAAGESLQAELSRLRPAECLLLENWAAPAAWEVLQEQLRLRCTPCAASFFDLALARQYLAALLGETGRQQHSTLALCAAGAIVQYVQAMHHATLPHLTTLQNYQLSHYLILDAITRRNLELVRTLRHGDRKGSVLEVLDETVTAMGARLLRRWLEQPLAQRDAIEARLEAVEELCTDSTCRQQLRQVLRRMHDIERLIARVACGTATARHLVALRISLAYLPEIRQSLATARAPLLQTLRDACNGAEAWVALMQRAIVDEPPITLRDGGLIRPGYDAALDRLIEETADHTSWIARLQARERQQTGIKSLKVGFNQVFGYYIEISKANLHLVPDHYIRKQTLTNGERFITEKLKEREVAILYASEQRFACEYRLFCELREHIARQAAMLQQIAAAVAQLDTLATLAEVAALYDYVRPTMTAEAHLYIEQGRHPVVERALDGFVPNDVSLAGEAQRLLILTGPNMAGKSTYLRQIALITLLAHIGSFVPARAASIGLVDRIFTRVGAIDDIAAGRSTFLVEMSETAHILHHATARSLLILDEIGKGTSTSEGLSIAWAVALYLARRLQARALFATHFHELIALENLTEGVYNRHLAVRETPEGVVFLRQVVPGGSSKSYGLHVARLAGLPDEILSEAEQVLRYIEQSHTPLLPGSVALPEFGQRGVADHHVPYGTSQIPAMFNGASSEVHTPAEALLHAVMGLDICQITPLQAINLLHELQQQARAAGYPLRGLS